MTDLTVNEDTPMVRRATIIGNMTDLHPSWVELKLLSTLHTVAGMPARDLIEAKDQQAVRNRGTRTLVKQRMPD